MKTWNNPEITVLDISKTSEKKDDAWATWECPNRTCRKKQETWGHCKDCATYHSYTTNDIS